MTILSVVQSAATRLALGRPLAVFSSTDKAMLEMQEVANESARVIAEAHEWQVLKSIATFTGTGAQSAFNMPSDYDRMLARTSIWTSRWQWSADHIASADEWLGLTTAISPIIGGQWVIYGDQLHLLPTMATGETVKFFYVSDLIVKAANGTKKELFTADTDTFRLDERLLKLAIVWSWKAAKGLPYAEDMENYEKQLDKAMTKDGGSKPVVSSRWSDERRSVRTAWPGVVGPPL